MSDTPMPDASAADEPKADEPMADEPKADEPMTNEPLPVSQDDTGLVSGHEAKEEDGLARSPRDPVTGAERPQDGPMDRPGTEAEEAALRRDTEI